MYVKILLYGTPTSIFPFIYTSRETYTHTHGHGKHLMGDLHIFEKIKNMDANLKKFFF